jgi:Zn-dependent protease
MFSVDFNQAIQLIIILLISIDLHEFAHSVVADQLGDPTPRRNGQISLNPLVHMDQIGVLVLVISSLAGIAFAWGRTFVQPQNLKFGPQRGGAIVSAAGPLTNLLVAVIVAVILRFAESSGCINPGGHNLFGATFDNVSVAEFFTLAVRVNLALFVINLIPLPPLDGFTIVSGFLTPRQLYSLAPIIQYGPMILFLLVALSFSGYFSIFGAIYNAVDQIGASILPTFPYVPVCAGAP